MYTTFSLMNASKARETLSTRSMQPMLVRFVLFAVLGIGLAGCAGQPTAVGDAPGGSHSVALAWDASASAVSGYHVYRATDPSGFFIWQRSTPAGTTQYTDTAVEAGHSYFYVVTAFDSANNVESAPSNEASATIPIP